MREGFPNCVQGKYATSPKHAIRGKPLEQELPHLRLRYRTLLVLPTPPVPGHATRLVHRQRGGRQQRQQGGCGVEDGGRVPQIVNG